MDSNEIIICTIFSKNYLAHVRALADSFYKIHPKGKMFALLVDDIDGHFDPKKEKFNLVNINEIGIENLQSFCFKYTVVEQNTGAKAHFLLYLLKKYDFKKIIYLDPDILIINSLENLWKLLEKKSILLTPHILEHVDDDKKPSESDLKKAGIFNLGFIALANTASTEKFLNWWKEKLYNYCLMAPEKGFHVDQKWVDKVPDSFNDVYIIKHPGYNVAYWNLMQRKVLISKDKLLVNDKPLYFFHFSGFLPENIELVSKHQNRFVLKDLENIKPLFELYRDLLVENGYLDVKNWDCKFDYFYNNIKIPAPARSVYRDAVEQGLDFGNPFEVEGKNSFFNYLNENVDDGHPIVTQLWYQVYKDRKDLNDSFPSPLKNDREAFVRWVKNSLEFEYDFAEVFLPSHIFQKSFQDFNHRTTIPSQILNEEKKVTKLNIENQGINIIGYFKGEFGVGESGRSYVLAIKNAGISHVLNNVIASGHRNKDQTLQQFAIKNPYPINLAVVNADQTKYIYDEFKIDFFKDKYNIGVWVWELDNFPENFNENLKFHNEIWAPSSFAANSISKSSPIPVLRIPFPIELEKPKLIRNKEKFNLKKEDFVFLFMFDFFSVFQRKNPLGLIRAFKRTFNENENAKLFIKSINGSKFPKEKNELFRNCDSKNIIFVDEHMAKDELLSLLASSDCYVSLHRSEGFGITIAEAMYAKKPVIATAYGGNTDFMSINNSYPVKYKLIELDDDFGPYKKGNRWAEPDELDASKKMRFVFENQNEARDLGIKASDYIKQNYSPKIVGKEIQNRLSVIIRKKR